MSETCRKHFYRISEYLDGELDEGGAVYDVSGGPAQGIATVADSLADQRLYEALGLR